MKNFTYKERPKVGDSLIKKMCRLFLSTIFLSFILTLGCYAATNTTIGSGDWSDASIWSLGTVPASTDDVVITNDVTINSASSITVNSITISAGSLDPNTTTTINITTFLSIATEFEMVGSGTCTVNLGGNFLMPGNGAQFNRNNGTLNLNFAGTGTQNVIIGYPTASGGTGGTLPGKVNFTVNTGSTVVLDTTFYLSNKSTFIVNGTLDCKTFSMPGEGNANGQTSINSGATLKTGSLLGVNYAVGQSSGVPSLSSGANYVFEGTGTGVVGSYLPSTVNSLTLNLGTAASTVTTNNSVLTVTSSLNLNQGILNAGNGTVATEISVTNASPSSVTDYSSASYINGYLQRVVNSGTNNYDFPLGTSTNYELGTIAFNNQTGVTDITGSFNPSTSAVTLNTATCTINGTPISNVLNGGMWTFAANGNSTNYTLTGGTYNVTLNETGFINGSTTTKDYGVIKYDALLNSGNWAGCGGANPTIWGTASGLPVLYSSSLIVAERRGLNSFSGFAIGMNESRFKPGDLIVYRVDNGSSPLSSGAANVYVDEYEPTGTNQTPVLSIVLPGTNTLNGFTESGTDVSDGLLSLSVNNRYIVCPGYFDTTGTLNSVSTSSSSNPRLIARIDTTETVYTAAANTPATEITDGYNTSNFRSVCTNDGNEFWTGGNDANSGVRYVSAPGNTTSAAISASQTSTNTVRIVNGQLYTYVKGSGLYTVGTGLPTAGGQTMTLLSNTNSGAGADFVLFDVNGSTSPELLYVADQTNGIYKYTSVNGTTWTPAGSYLAVSGGVEGITGYVDCNGNAQLFYTDQPGGEGNNLWSVTDNNAYTSGGISALTPVKLATASSTSPHQTGFRGVAFAPIASYPTLTLGNPNTSTICYGANVSLSASEMVDTASVNGVTYTWTPSTGLSDSTGSSVIATPSVTTTYTIEASSPYPNMSASPVIGEGCISTTMVVNVTQLPVANAGNAPDTICSGSSYIINNASVANNTSFSWTSSSSCNACFNSTSDLNPVYTPSATDITNGSVTLTLSANGNLPCFVDSLSSKTITIIPLATANAGILPTVPICSIASFTVTNASVTNDSSFSWASSSSCNTCFSSVTDLNPVYTPSATDITNGSVTLTLTSVGNSSCGNNTSSLTIDITESSSAYAGNAPDTICPGSAYTVINASVAGNSSFLWASSSGCNSCFNSVTDLNPVYTPNATDIANGVVTLSLITIGNSPCGNDTSSKVITIDTGTLSLIILPQSPSVCAGEKVTLKLPVSGSGYTWSPSSTLSSSTGDSVTAAPSSVTVYIVTGTDSLGCALRGIDTVKINSAPLLIIQPQGAQSVCPGQSIALSVPVSGTNYSWNPSITLNTSTGDTVIASPLVQTTYTVSGIDSLGCVSSDSEIVDISNAPNKPTIMVSGDILTSSATQGNQWVRNDTILTGATTENYTATIPGWYQVIAENPANGCSTTSDSVDITSGINQLSVISNQLSIYPNPTNGEIILNISSSAENVKNWELQITDVLGRIVYTQLSLNYYNAIDLSNLANGMYFICVMNKTDKAVVPVVKE